MRRGTRRAVTALASALALSWVLTSAAPQLAVPAMTGDGLVRAVAAGAAPNSRVVEFLSRDALVVRADDDLKAAIHWILSLE